MGEIKKFLLVSSTNFTTIRRDKYNKLFKIIKIFRNRQNDIDNINRYKTLFYNNLR